MKSKDKAALFSVHFADVIADDTESLCGLPLKDARYSVTTVETDDVNCSTCRKFLAARRTMKPTNPKDAMGIAKAPLSTVPAGVLLELGLAMFEGALKYGRHNYRETDVRASVYYDAGLRHWLDWWEGTDDDPDSGMSHLVKAMACALVLRDAQRQGKLVDDRPPGDVGVGIAQLNERAAALLKKYPNPKPAKTRKP